jgi:hypothetical protein
MGQEYVVLHNALLELRERKGMEPIDIKLMAKRVRPFSHPLVIPTPFHVNPTPFLVIPTPLFVIPTSLLVIPIPLLMTPTSLLLIPTPFSRDSHPLSRDSEHNLCPPIHARYNCSTFGTRRRAPNYPEAHVFTERGSLNVVR